MGLGYWGGRLPLLNATTSAWLRFAVHWRRGYLKSKNRIRNALARHRPVAVNPADSRAQLQRWLAQGFDKLNIGGGTKNLEGFVNVDFVPHGAQREIVANILDLAFVPDQCLSQVHSNHVIEHLTDDQLVEQLKQYRRVLRSGGRVSLRCPNALSAAYAFWFEPILEDRRDAFVSLGFPRDEDFRNPADRWLHRDLYGFLHWIYGDVGNPRNEHLNMITPTMIRRHLEAAGFEILIMTEPEALNIVAVAANP